MKGREDPKVFLLSSPTLALPPAFAEAASRRQASKGEEILGEI
jgi:hypothetical protein